VKENEHCAATVSWVAVGAPLKLGVLNVVPVTMGSVAVVVAVFSSDSHHRDRE